MGIIYPQAVKMRVNSRNVNYYEKLGYAIPMKKASSSTYNRYHKEMVYDYTAYFDVSIDDVSKGSEVNMWFICDCCGKLNYMLLEVYYRNHKTIFEPIYCRECLITTLNKGELHPLWNSSITDKEREIKRKYPEYIDFTKRVLARDNYICQCCGKKSEGNLVVHHLNGFSWDKEHRTDDANGITLCEACHKNFHSLYGNRNVTKEMFEEWIGHRIELTKYTDEMQTLPRVYCIEDNIIYKDRFEAADNLNCDYSTLWYVCTGRQATYLGKHYVYYENYLKMNQDEISELLQKGRRGYRTDKRVICKNTGLIYNKPSEAAKALDYKYVENINNVCNGIQKSAAKLNGVSLQWMWLTDFNNLSTDKQIQIAKENKKTLIKGSFLYDLLFN